jgi:hypothetical protein
MAAAVRRILATDFGCIGGSRRAPISLARKTCDFAVAPGALEPSRPLAAQLVLGPDLVERRAELHRQHVERAVEIVALILQALDPTVGRAQLVAPLAIGRPFVILPLIGFGLERVGDRLVKAGLSAERRRPPALAN